MTEAMVPLAAPFANSKAFQGSSSRSHMLSLSSSFPQNSFCRSQNVVNGFVPAGVRAENELRLSHWLESAKKANDLAKSCQDCDSECPKVGAESVTESSGIGAESDGPRKDSSPVTQSLNGCKASCQALTQMNGADDFRMTGSSNPRADQLNWLADVATGAAAAAAAARAPQNSSPTVEGSDKGSSRPPAHLQGSDAMTPRSSFGSVLLGVGPMGQRMYPSQYHLEHFHPTSATAGSALSLYYSQAPRSAAAYAGFYQADPRLQYCASVTDGLVSTRMPRPYFQGELYPPAMASIPGVQLQNARAPLPHSPSYLHQAASLSPVGPGSPTPPHARLSTVQATGLMHSRSPEEITPPDKGRLSLQAAASNHTHYHHPEDAKRPSYSSPEPKTQSPVGERLATSPYLSDYQGSKDLAARQNASPSHVAYKIPTGKEGSLKHRILRPPSINIVDPPPVAHDAPLSAPPIRSHREPSPKQVRQDGYSSYRSFSTSGSFLLDGGHVAPSTSQGPAAAAFGVPTCTLPAAAAAVEATAPGIGAPHGVRSSDCTSQLKYPPAFMKGSIIQLANSQLKPVEDMTTEDFLECEAMSPNLKIDSSTVISIEKMPVSGSAKLGFSVGEKKFQITVEAPLEHPFFVYRQGWSSCCPERSMLRYGLNCHKLKVGDTCIFLTVKSELPCQPVSQNSVPSPKPPVLVPTANVALSAPKKPQESVLQPAVVGIPGTADSGHVAMVAKSSTVSANSSSSNNNNNNNSGEGTTVQKETPSVPTSLHQKISMLFSENSNSNDGSTPPPKRKRRWSFPGRLSSSSPPSSSATKN